MADLNKLMSEVEQIGSRVDGSMKELLSKYEALYREAHRAFMAERSASKTMKGLEDFYLAVGSIRRNRDIIGSMVRGLKNLKRMKNFRFVVEDIPEPVRKHQSTSKSSNVEDSIEIPENYLEETAS